MLKKSLFFFLFCVLLFFSNSCLAQVVAVKTPVVFSESVIPGSPSANQATLKGSVWTSEGKPAMVKVWFEYKTLGGAISKTAETYQLSNSGFYTYIPYEPTKTYCFTTYAQRVTDDNQHTPISQVAKGADLCYPKIPWVKTLDYTLDKNKVTFRGQITNFAGNPSAQGWFKYYLQGQEAQAQTTQQKSVFPSSPIFSDSVNLPTSNQDQTYCFRAYASPPASTLQNYGEEKCFVLNRSGSEVDKPVTMMFYLAYDNNIDMGVTIFGIWCEFYDANQSINGKINLVFFYDGKIDGDTKIFTCDKGKMKIIKDLGEKNSGDYLVFQDFLDYAITNYPGSKYYLTIHNHGGGYGRGATITPNLSPNLGSIESLNIAKDDKYGTTITDDQENQVLFNIRKKFNIHKFGLIFHEACLMQQIESLEYLQDDAEAIVGAWDTAIINRAILSGIFKYAKASDIVDGNTFGSWIIKNLEKRKEYKSLDYSSADISRLPELILAVDNLATELIKYLNNDPLAKTTLREIFGLSIRDGSGYTLLPKLLLSIINSPKINSDQVKNAAKKALQIHDNSVTCDYAGDRIVDGIYYSARSGGLGIQGGIFDDPMINQFTRGDKSGPYFGLPFAQKTHWGDFLLALWGNNPQINSVPFAVTFPSLTPKVFTESVLPGTTNATLKASAWINEGKAMKINTWFEYWVQGSGTKTLTTKKLSDINKNLSFNDIIPFNNSKVYCFIPYAQLVDNNQKPLSDIGQGTQLCFPKIPWVETRLPAAVKDTSAYFRGEITSFQGLTGVIGFFRRWYQKTPTQVKQDGYQFLPKPANADNKEFGYFYSDFNTPKNGNYCYQACAKDLPANAKVNCDKETCFPDTGGQDQDYFKVEKKAEALTDPADCQQAKITIDIYCQGEKVDSKRPDLDVILLIDKSGTMKGIALDKTKQAAIEFVNKLDSKKDRVSVISFSDWGTVENAGGLTNDFAQVTQAIAKIAVGGNSTNLGDGFKKSNDTFAKQGRANAQKKIVLITDGIVNGGENGSPPNAPSWPITDNIYTNYAIAQSSIAKNTHKAEIYIVRYSESSIDQAHVQAAAFSKQLLQKIASPGQYFQAPTPDFIIQLFAQIVFSLTKTETIPIVCKNMKVTDVLTDGAKLVKIISPPATTINGQTIVWDLGNVAGHRQIELIVRYPNANPQLAEKYPDSKVEFVDMEGNKQTKELPEVTVKDLIKCSGVDMKVDKKVEAMDDQAHCLYAKVTLRVECIIADSSAVDPNKDYICKNVKVIDVLPAGVEYKDSAQPKEPDSIVNNGITNPTTLTWKVGDMKAGDVYIITFLVKFPNANPGQKADVDPDSRVEFDDPDKTDNPQKRPFPNPSVNPIPCPECEYKKSKKVAVVFGFEGRHSEATKSYISIKNQAFQQYQFEYFADLPFNLDDFDTLFINYCLAIAHVQDEAKILDWIKKGNKYIRYTFGCTNSGGEYPGLGANDRPFNSTNTVVIAPVLNSKFDIVQEMTLGSKNQTASSYLDLGKIDTSVLHKNYDYFGSNNAWCSHITLAGDVSGAPKGPKLVQIYRTYGKGFVIYNGFNFRAIPEQDKNKDIPPGNTNEQEVLEKMFLQALQQEWDITENKKCTPCVPVPPNSSDFDSTFSEFVKMDQITEQNGLLSVSAIISGLNDVYFGYFQLCPIGSSNAADCITFGRQAVIGNKFSSFLNRIFLQNNYCLNAVVEGQSHPFYSKTICGSALSGISP